MEVVRDSAVCNALILSSAFEWLETRFHLSARTSFLGREKRIQIQRQKEQSSGGNVVFLSLPRLGVEIGLGYLILSLWFCSPTTVLAIFRVSFASCCRPSPFSSTMSLPLLGWQLVVGSFRGRPREWWSSRPGGPAGRPRDWRGRKTRNIDVRGFYSPLPTGHPPRLRRIEAVPPVVRVQIEKR